MRTSAIITSHDNYEGLIHMLGQLERQTLPPWEIIAIASDLKVNEQQADDLVDRCDLIVQPNRNDWGHEKRAMGVELALGDYLAFFNDDDEYSPAYLEKLAQEAEATGADIVACRWVSHLGAPDLAYLPEPRIGGITSGNFIVRTDIAKKAGYNGRQYEADGQFIEDCMKAGATFSAIEELLYEHK